MVLVQSSLVLVASAGVTIAYAEREEERELDFEEHRGDRAGV